MRRVELRFFLSFYGIILSSMVGFWSFIVIYVLIWCVVLRKRVFLFEEMILIVYKIMNGIVLSNECFRS